MATMKSATPYDLRYVNASVDLEALVNGLRANPSGSILLYGPPGTGKTAFVRHMADRIGRPLVGARASDLLDCWLGGTEENIARIFRRATSERAILFLDEVDSFLQDRARAQRSWEVTQVNELLVQIESFSGLLVCATNLVEQLDDASQRRFALKIRFEPLRTEQALDLLRALVAVDDADARYVGASVAGLGAVTPGDFAATVRRLRLLGGTPCAASFVETLEGEVRMKRSAKPIGFK
jgi:SpoVK/Ycf46/Vps4 family AAA+-type ATPase